MGVSVARERVGAWELAARRHAIKDLTIQIVNYNTRRKTLDCIRSIRSSKPATSHEIIVVDNASSDGSVEALRLNFPDIKIIACQTNLGFAAANNLAERHAHGQKLLLLNPDTIVLGRAIDELYQFALANPRCRTWGGRSIHPDGSFDWSCKRKLTLWNVFCSAVGLSVLLNHPEEYRGWNHDTVREVDYLSGAFLLVDRDLWRALGGFDPSFFMYGEDQDLCLRAHRLGAHPTFTPVATVVHHGASSEHDESEKRIKLMAGEVTIMKHHWSTIGASFGRLLYLILPHPRWLVYGLLGAITRRTRLRQKAAVWWRVWQCRGRWMDGWPLKDSIACPMPPITDR